MAVADLGRGVRKIVVGVGALAFAAPLRESPGAALTGLAVAEEEAAELAGMTVTMEKDAPAVREEMRLEASAGGRVCVSVGRVTAPLAGRVIVIVTVVLSSPESSGVPSACPLSLSSSSSEEQSSSPSSSVLEVELAIGKGTVTFDDAVDTTPPFAPVADIIDWALFGLVHATNW